MGVSMDNESERRPQKKMSVVEKIINRETNGDNCPHCSSQRVEIELHDFRQKSLFFIDLWYCMDCGNTFWMRTKRRQTHGRADC